MGRWEPDARSRLERAALDLFVERGFEQTTVPDITARAGLTTRTFFRHFADKREVLFGGDDAMPAMAARLVLAAPPELAPMVVVQQGLSALAGQFDQQREQLLQRRTIIAGNEGLRERELRKMQRLTDAVAEAFRARGVDELTAAVVAGTAVAVVQVAIGRWIEDPGQLSLAEGMENALLRLAAAFDDLIPPI